MNKLTGALTFNDVYKNLDGMIALQVAASMPLRRHKDEKDTAFVKRIVAAYIVCAGRLAISGKADSEDDQPHEA